MTIQLGPMHHVALTVSDQTRSRDFYTSIFDLKVLTIIGPKMILANESLILGLNVPPDPAQAIPNDRFSESRLGLDHISFSVPNYNALEAAVKFFDEKGIAHGTINNLGEAGIPIYVLSFRDPDNIQLELTAPNS